VLGDAEAQVEGPRNVGTGEVLVEVAEHVLVVDRGREDVHEAEQLRLERRVRHRPLQHPLAPPGRLDHGAFGAGTAGAAGAEIGEAAGQDGDAGIERRGHTQG
jgi:hypothetical protein